MDFTKVEIFLFPLIESGSSIIRWMFVTIESRRSSFSRGAFMLVEIYAILAIKKEGLRLIKVGKIKFPTD